MIRMWVAMALGPDDNQYLAHRLRGVSCGFLVNGRIFHAHALFSEQSIAPK